MSLLWPLPLYCKHHCLDGVSDDFFFFFLSFMCLGSLFVCGDECQPCIPALSWSLIDGSDTGQPTPRVKDVFPSHFVAVLVLMLKQGSEEFNVSR